VPSGAHLALRGNATPAAVGDFPVEAAADLNSDTIYVANDCERTVSMIDGSTCNATDISGCRAHPATLSVLGGPDSVAVNQATNTLFVANN
jgi:DNA-binding beta-propeller fold protein YncE